MVKTSKSGQKFRPRKDADATKTCLCGCGGNPKGRFLPGHDAKLKGQLKREAKGDDRDAASAAVARLASLGWSWVLDTTPEQREARKAQLAQAKIETEERRAAALEVANHKQAKRGEAQALGLLKSVDDIDSEYKAGFRALQTLYGKHGVTPLLSDGLNRQYMQDMSTRIVLLGSSV